MHYQFAAMAPSPEFGRDSADMSWVEWTSALKLSLMWQEKLVPDLALQKIEALVEDSNGWVGALRLSSQLKIQGLQDLSIRMLSGKLATLMKTELAIECKIRPLLLAGYTEFVTREETISVEDEKRLGWDTTFKLFCVRHRRFQGHNHQKDVENTLQNELADVTMFNDSPISYLHPNLHTAINPDVIQRDKLYYHDYIIFSVNFLSPL